MIDNDNNDNLIIIYCHANSAAQRQITKSILTHMKKNNKSNRRQKQITNTEKKETNCRSMIKHQDTNSYSKI
jgi:hypothetical protein